MPVWHYKLAKPFKKLLLDNVSLDMYYCVQFINSTGRPMTMTQLANEMHMPKQRMTKIVDGLIEHNLAERVSDADDRRIIRIKLTENGFKYIDKFLDEYAVYFRELSDSMSETDKDELGKALKTLFGILKSLPCSYEISHQGKEAKI